MDIEMQVMEFHISDVKREIVKNLKIAKYYKQAEIINDFIIPIK